MDKIKPSSISIITIYTGIFANVLCGIYLSLSIWVYPGILHVKLLNVGFILALSLVVAGRISIKNKILIPILAMSLILIVTCVIVVSVSLPKYTFNQAQNIILISISESLPYEKVEALPDYPDVKVVRTENLNLITKGKYRLFFNVNGEVISYLFNPIRGDYTKFTP